MSVENRERFCVLADEYRSAFDSAYGVSGVRSDAEHDWQKQLEFYSTSATLVDSEAIDPVSGTSWRNLLLARSDQQAAMNLKLASLNWNLGAYPDTKSSSRVGGAPNRLILSVCDQDPAS